MSVCYVLIRNDGRASYCGVTNCFERRLRQHNGGIQGGARYTRGQRWSPLCIVHGFRTRAQALSFEWHVKHCASPSGGVLRRRAHQVYIALRAGHWWKRHPPCPDRMSVSWFGEGGAPRWPGADEVPFAIVCGVPATGLVAVHPTTQHEQDGPPSEDAPVETQRPPPAGVAPHATTDPEDFVPGETPTAPTSAVGMQDHDRSTEDIGQQRPHVDVREGGDVVPDNVLRDPPSGCHDAAASH
jgi:predicted GIY-YIG superfamily endonuclease